MMKTGGNEMSNKINKTNNKNIERNMNMKKKTLLIGSLALLATTGVIGAAFATWYVSTDGGDSATGNLTADSVAETPLTVNLTWVTDATGDTPLGSDPNIIFGRPETMNASNPWLTNDSSLIDNLTAYLKVEVANSDKIGTLTASFTATEADSEHPYWSDAVTAGYVVAPDLSGFDKTDLDSTGVAVLEVTFSWGSTFGGDNPYDYYNALSAGAYSTAAVTALQAVENAASATFTVTVSATVA